MRQLKKILAGFLLVFVFSMVLSLPKAESSNESVIVVQAAQKCKLNKKSVTLVKSEKVTLKLKKAVAKKVVWKSKNAKIASVTSKGKVTGKKKGKTTIIAKYQGKQYKCKVTVETPKLSNTTLKMSLGEQKTIKLSGTKQKVKWSSDDTSVVTVKNGVLTAVGTGYAYVSAKVGTKSYECTVDVPAPELNATYIKLDKGTTYTVQLVNAVAYNWQSSDSRIISVDAYGNVVALRYGLAYVTCQDINGNEYRCNVTVNPINMSIQPISTVYTQPLSTKYYLMKVLVQNYSNENCFIDYSTALYYPYGIDYNYKKDMILCDEYVNDASASAPLEIPAGTWRYIYGFEGTSYQSITSTGQLTFMVNIDGIEYLVITDADGTISAMSISNSYNSAYGSSKNTLKNDMYNFGCDKTKASESGSDYLIEDFITCD